jgi:hypothetical protein
VSPSLALGIYLAAQHQMFLSPGPTTELSYLRSVLVTTKIDLPAAAAGAYKPCAIRERSSSRHARCHLGGIGLDLTRRTKRSTAPWPMRRYRASSAARDRSAFLREAGHVRRRRARPQSGLSKCLVWPSLRARRRLILAHPVCPVVAPTSTFDPAHQRETKAAANVASRRWIATASLATPRSPAGVIAHPSAPQFSSSQACISVSWAPNPPGGMPSLIRHGNRRSASWQLYQFVAMAQARHRPCTVAIQELDPA